MLKTFTAATLLVLAGTFAANAATLPPATPTPVHKVTVQKVAYTHPAKHKLIHKVHAVRKGPARCMDRDHDMDKGKCMARDTDKHKV